MNIIIIFLILLIVISPVNADIYKCKVNGKTSYQSMPCKSKGKQFLLKPDISPEQHHAAVVKLNAEIAARAEMERINQEKYDKERVLRAKEEIARSTQFIAINFSRLADALEFRNRMRTTKPIRYNYY